MLFASARERASVRDTFTPRVTAPFAHSHTRFSFYRALRVYVSCDQFFSRLHSDNIRDEKASREVADREGEREFCGRSCRRLRSEQLLPRWIARVNALITRASERTDRDWRSAYVPRELRL